MALPSAVAEHLDFDVARPLQIFFQIDRVVAECGLGLGAGGGQRGGKLVLQMRDLHAAAAAAGSGLHQHRKADAARDRKRVGVGRHAAVGARHHRDAEPKRRALGLDLVAHQADVLGLGPDELDAVLGQDFGKAGVLRQKPVARMNGVGAGDLAGGEQRRNVEVAVLRGRRADADAFVGEPHVHGVGIRGRVHRDRRNAKLLAGAQHPQRDLAAVGDQDFVEHDRLRVAITFCATPLHHSITTSGSPNSTGWASSIRTCVTVPERGAGIWFMVFIASMISSVSPTTTLLPTSTNGIAPGSGPR